MQKELEQSPRTPEVEAAYQKFLKENNGKKINLHYNPIVWQDENYIIVKNTFPYKEVKDNDMILYKDWGRQGLDSLLSRAGDVINELGYDFCRLNAENMRSVVDTPHVHLIRKL